MNLLPMRLTPDLVQLAESRIVIPVATGSSLVSHPN